jgi:hypothetical protein
MKLFAVILGFAIAGTVSSAHAGIYQEAVQKTLESPSLKTVTANYNALELVDIKVEKLSYTKSGTGEFALTLYYSAVGTAGGCYVNVNATHSEMETIMPGGVGYEILHFWKVDAKAGLCPR